MPGCVRSSLGTLCNSQSSYVLGNCVLSPFIDEETNRRCLSNLSRIIKPESDRYLNPRKLESGTYLLFFSNHNAHLPPWGNQDGLWRSNTHTAMVNWGDGSWSLTCCIFKGLLTWVIGRAPPLLLCSRHCSTTPLLQTPPLFSLKVASYE